MKLLPLWAFTCCVWLTVNTAQANVMKPFFKDGAFSETYELIQQSEPEALKLQTLATYYTFVGRQDLQSDLGGAFQNASTQCLVHVTDTAQKLNARDWLLEQTAEKRVVMFNENHFRIEARLFVRELLGALKEQGFTHIGLEAFSQPSAETHDATYQLRPEDGFYTHEPIFASLIHRAYDLGFEVFGYESTEPVPGQASFAERVSIREEAQANNILERLNSADKSSKFVIFAGWSHIAETPRPPEDSLWMAARLKAKSGIDPFTVDLTSCAVAANSASESVVYLDSSAQLDSQQILVSGQYAGAVDAQVHLAIPGGKSIQSWFYRQHIGQPIALPAQLEDSDQPLLARAYATDRSTGVPIDQVLVYPGEAHHLKLYVPAGQAYRLRVYSGIGEVVFESSNKEE